MYTCDDMCCVSFCACASLPSKEPGATDATAARAAASSACPSLRARAAACETPPTTSGSGPPGLWGS